MTKLRCERRWSHPCSNTANKCFNELLIFIFRVLRDITAHQTLNKGSECLSCGGVYSITFTHCRKCEYPSDTCNLKVTLGKQLYSVSKNISIKNIQKGTIPTFHQVIQCVKKMSPDIDIKIDSVCRIQPYPNR